MRRQLETVRELLYADLREAAADSWTHRDTEQLGSLLLEDLVMAVERDRRAQVWTKIVTKAHDAVERRSREGE